AALFRAAGRPDKGDAQAGPNIEAFDTELGAQESNITEAGEAEATRRLRDAWNEYRAKYDAFRRIGGEQELRRHYFEELQPEFLRIKDAAERILEINQEDRKSTRLNSSHVAISYAVFCLKKKKKTETNVRMHIKNSEIRTLD